MGMTARQRVWERAEGRSELSGVPLRASDWECHHRRPAGKGGHAPADQQSLANQVALTPREHNMDPRSVHLDPRWGKSIGFLLPRGQGLASIPHLVPIWWRGREWRYLTASGVYVPVGAGARPQRAGGTAAGERTQETTRRRAPG